jgi:hypothetical protein
MDLSERLAQVVAAHQQLTTNKEALSVELHRLEGEHRLLAALLADPPDAQPGPEPPDAQPRTRGHLRLMDDPDPGDVTPDDREQGLLSDDGRVYYTDLDEFFMSLDGQPEELG